MLGVHAAIRRYRWEYRRLPDSLEQLKLGAVAIDPFTGKPLAYRRVDDRSYTLSSIGPDLPDAQGVRQPLMLP
jgi:hypothetical protein